MYRTYCIENMLNFDTVGHLTNRFRHLTNRFRYDMNFHIMHDDNLENICCGVKQINTNKYYSSKIVFYHDLSWSTMSIHMLKTIPKSIINKRILFFVSMYIKMCTHNSQTLYVIDE